MIIVQHVDHDSQESADLRHFRNLPLSGRTSGFSERRQGDVPLEALLIAASLQSLVRPLFVAISLCALVLYNKTEAIIHQGDLKMSVAESAKKVYEEDLRSRLEQEHKDDFVAIEPSSRSFFLGKTFLEVALAAKKAFPDRKSFVIRIGHEAAFHIGAFVPGF